MPRIPLKIFLAAMHVTFASPAPERWLVSSWDWGGY